LEAKSSAAATFKPYCDFPQVWIAFYRVELHLTAVEQHARLRFEENEWGFTIEAWYR
jgi:hypothetical protein